VAEDAAPSLSVLEHQAAEARKLGRVQPSGMEKVSRIRAQGHWWIVSTATSDSTSYSLNEKVSKISNNEHD
jgi:hypothetical protein